MKEKLDKGYVTIATDPDPEPDPEPEPEAPKAKGAKKAKAPKKAPAPDPAPAPEPAPEPAPDAADPEGWVEAEDGYALRLVDGALVCRNDKGKVLASVPPKVKQGEVGERMLALEDLLAAHEAECRATVDGWMLGSLPVPGGLLAEVWVDPSWRGALENLVVAPVVGGEVALARGGLFRGVDPKRGLGLVNLDGESTWVAADAVLAPHPVRGQSAEKMSGTASILSRRSQSSPTG